MLTKLIIEEIVNSVKCNVNCDSFNPYFVNTVKSLMTKLNICKFNIYLCIVVLFLLIMPIFDIDWYTLSTTESHSIFLFQKLGASPSVSKKLLKQNKNCTVYLRILFVWLQFVCLMSVLTKCIKCQCWQISLLKKLSLSATLFLCL